MVTNVQTSGISVSSEMAAGCPSPSVAGLIVVALKIRKVMLGFLV